MQCRQIVGKTRGIKTIYDEMDIAYTAMLRPIISYACVS